MKLLITQFSPTSYHFISLLSKHECSLQHPIFVCPESIYVREVSHYTKLHETLYFCIFCNYD
jgi:hypothetical protein